MRIDTQHYPIIIARNILQKPKSWLKKRYSAIVIITDQHVKNKFAESLLQKLKSINKNVMLLTFKAGEQQKNMQTVLKLQDKLLKQQVDRHALILALGGGVVGDMAGFIAATFLRGIDYIQLPTTLLAMVDSSVGGKTGVNTNYGKNLIGCFYRPKAVIADTNCLLTLSKKQRLNGYIEAIKIFLTCDAMYFRMMEKVGDIEQISQKQQERIIYRAVQLKSTIVAQDEKEQGLRAILNFGHTIGHALEKLSEYRLLHGYAVAYGMLLEAQIAAEMGVLPMKDNQRIQAYLQGLGFHAKYFRAISLPALLKATRNDKKAQEGKVKYILLQAIGAVYINDKQVVHDVADNIVATAYHALLNR